MVKNTSKTIRLKAGASGATPEAAKRAALSQLERESKRRGVKFVKRTTFRETVRGGLFYCDAVQEGTV